MSEPTTEPIRLGVLELEPTPELHPAPHGLPVTTGEVSVIVRRRGVPVALLRTRIPEGADPLDHLAALAPDGPAPEPAPPADPATRVSVIVATREHPDKLDRALTSLLELDHPDYEIVVVDNNPVTGATKDLVTKKYAEAGVRYVTEPVPGLAAAHNRGIAEAKGAILAFTDDDVVADPRWLRALTAGFAEDPHVGCVTGLIVPGSLETPAQIQLERLGGFGKGFARKVYDIHRPPADEPLFPFTAGSFGSGANMAFRAEVLRTIGGFDPATGTGTQARGGDDLYAFVRTLVAGHRLVYEPRALIWHYHRERIEDLTSQAFNYGAGVTAYLTAVIARRPALLPRLLRRVPGGLRHARTLTGERTERADPTTNDPWPRRLARTERRGMLYGPVGYLRARRRMRGIALPWEGKP
ncbi:glycosyltransferase [Streptomyces sp. A7024]|uniref:Glycosyltransferase n=1 Tax=Streptomyces coryli TaxID=1128680 RepID=A0A6G4UCB6_9ACTN|nr:glycosyltransferase [Streptomyces coryli]NGN69814.1 glycosyltransferase [Streptomyces coryli]